jgi:hypothetical protein
MNTKDTKEIVIIIGNNVARVPSKTWGALLKAAGLVIDTGDMYPLLDKVISADELHKVKDLKIALDGYSDSSS